MIIRISLLCACALLSATACSFFEDRGTEHVVEIVSDLDAMHMYFEPRTLVIAPGDTVTWVNKADIDHNVITYPDGIPKGAERIESPYLSTRGARWSYTFEVAGTYEYHCLPHLVMGMRGSVIVGQASTEADFHEPSFEEIAHYRNLLLEYFDGEDAEYHPRSERADLQ